MIRGQSLALSSSVAVRAIMVRVEPAVVARTSGLARRLRYHAGCRSSPPNEATSTRRSPSTIGAASIVERSLPDLRPVVTSSTTGISNALRSEEHSELQSRQYLVCRLLLEK